ncbi:hypothetical protein [Nostoc sp. TCL26-01]|uniref:hypothetical protein n=1 Tax=Nostoc sp. TCL26-01 TaxID=2576904 RepID=UPI0015C06BCE|nr:hypothetical protein [Nostoc sp. TCL26-01]QLE59722.1 hypothetical protein FD725_30260 [Nostoc sp. TCL26-01]
MKTLSTIIQNKILLAILAGVISIGSFQVWQHNKLEYEKLIAKREEDCQHDLLTGEVHIKGSRSLTMLRYNNVANPALKQPGNNTEFKKDEIYLLIKRKPDYLIPPNVSNYDSSFFKSLSSVGDYPPQPLAVKGVSIDIAKKKAVVSSYCSKTPFTVPLENIYETFQPNDYRDNFGFPTFLE